MDASIREEDCLSAVRNFLGSAGFALEGFTVRRVGGASAGFMGRHAKVAAAVRVGEKVREIRFFAKMPPVAESHRSFVIDSKLFHREFVAYTRMAPLLNAALPRGLTVPFPRYGIGCKELFTSRQMDRHFDAHSRTPFSKKLKGPQSTR
jgi:hypothetical protein